MNVLGFLVRRSFRLVAFAIGAGVVSGLAGAGVIALLHAATSAQGRPAPTLVWSFLGLCALSVLSKGISEVLLTQLGQTAIAEVRLELSRQILEAPLRRIEELGGHRLLATLNDDASVIAQAFVYLPLVCVNGATVVGCLVYLGWVSRAALVVVLAALVIGTALFTAHQRRAIHFFTRARETSDALFKHFRALTAGFKELKMHRLRREAFLSDHLGRSVTAYRKDFVAGMTVFSLATGWGTLLFYIVLGLAVFALPAWAGLSAPAVTGVTLALLYLMGPFAHIVEIMPAVGRAGVALAKWKDLGLALVPEVEPSPAPATAMPRTWKRLDLVGVTHSYYREYEEEVFRLGPVDLTFQPGEIVFLVGGNGSGKTTLALLLLGLYPPESGEILVDGVPVDETTRDQYRQLFSVVFADYHVFEDLLGLDDPALSERAQRYLERLHLDRRVRIEAGALRVSGLSTGQRKRLALLAASLEDRPFYVFDEWASDQDPQFRKIFYTELLPELRARGKTALVITHDDQYFGIADRCLRMDFGLLTAAAQVPQAVAPARNPQMRSTP